MSEVCSKRSSIASLHLYKGRAASLEAPPLSPPILNLLPWNFFLWVFWCKNMILAGYFILTCQVCCRSLSTASWRHLEEVFRLDTYLLFNLKCVFGRTWKVTWKRGYVWFCIPECAATARQLLLGGIWRNYHVLSWEGKFLMEILSNWKEKAG